MMSCQEFADSVTAYLEGRVPLGQRFGMAFHAMLCKHCRRYLAQMKMVVDLMGDVPKDEPERAMDAEKKSELMARFRDESGG